MGGTDLEGTRLPSGEHVVEGWKAHLWADATRNGDDAFRYDEEAAARAGTEQLVPYSMCQHVVFEATGGIEETMSRLTDDWQSGAALGGLRVEFHGPFEVGTPLQVEGRISDVVEKDGTAGPLTIATHSYTVETETGDAVYDLEADMVIMEDL